MSSMRYSDSRGLLEVRVSPIAIHTLRSHQQIRFWHNERGGVLLASSVGADDGVVDIVRATAPHPADRAGRCWLKLDHDRVLREINEGFAEGLHFVGYWHSHPELAPRLSQQDVAALLPTLQASDLDLQRVLMMVIGGRCGLLTADMCVVDRCTADIERLHPITLPSHATFASRPLQGSP